MNVRAGLAEGQVLQRLGKRRGACAQIVGTIEGGGRGEGQERRERREVCVTLRNVSGVVRGWERRRVGCATGSEFTARLQGIPAGGPWSLILECIQNKKTIARGMVREFFVGDVWLLAGQSNMEGGGLLAASVARPHPFIRAFSLARVWRQAADPLHVPWESQEAALNDGKPFTREQAEDYRRTSRVGAGVGLHFGREMLLRSGVPQGLICAARGATRMEQWLPARGRDGGAGLYGAMLRSVRATGQPVAGVLWHQGEGDSPRERAALYSQRMRKLIAAVRRDLGLPRLPWIFAQLARVYGERPDCAWNSVQEQQRALADRIHDVALVATVDLSLDDFIHLSAEAHPRFGARLARAADWLVYQNRKEQPPPLLRSVSALRMDEAMGAGRIDVVFDNVPGGLRAAGEARGFVLLGVDARGAGGAEGGTERVLPAIYRVTLAGNVARVYLLPEYVRAASKGAVYLLGYGYGNVPDCNITDGRDCALPVFGARRVRVG
ncbi:sialate O-acetylesterase [Geminisphaera colitermitum]|uniref:sialate O-acetylesterase n=1 Tax=Geminisphaera colitermitum TaxID=1148786 RepID=UPI0009DEA52E|nr:sialate O-acetylesterase [Geminisphaera colitermitum]